MDALCQNIDAMPWKMSGESVEMACPALRIALSLEMGTASREKCSPTPRITTLSLKTGTTNHDKCSPTLRIPQDGNHKP